MLHRTKTALVVVFAALPLVVGACQGTDDSEGDDSDTGVHAGADAAPDGAADPGIECILDTECDSGVCKDGACQAPACDDGVHNGSETAADCGGPCDGCEAGTACDADGDCATGRCDGGTCAEAASDDGIHNGDETATDCGGPCDPCALGEACESGDDCNTKACQKNVCVEPGCMDGAQNGAETDVDCGGPACAACEPGDDCGTDDDCTSGVCDGGSCAAGACDDGVQNGDESDVDCGSESCGPCETGSSCDEDSDCATSLCGGNDGATCVECTDGETRTSEKACGPDDRGRVTQECIDHDWSDTGCEGAWYANCADVAADQPNASSGTFEIDPDGPDGSDHAPRDVFCNMDYDQGGWTLVAVVSDDGQDHWTMTNRAYWTDDTTTFGSLDQLEQDYKNEGIQILPMKDLLFVHQPSGEWAAYHDVSNGQQSLGDTIAAHPYPFCYKLVANFSHSPDRGTIQIQGKMCDNELYFNLGDFDGQGEPYCKDLSGSDNRATFGPVWNIDNGDGCPFDDPAQAGLGPVNSTCANCDAADADTEVNALGWAGPAGLNTGESGKAENYMRIYVR